MKTVKNLEQNSTASLLSKVPDVTILFWIIKVLSTGMGEAASDYLNFEVFHRYNMAEIIVGSCLVIALIIQFLTKKYNTWVYWTNIIIISTFGAMFADNLRFGVVKSTIIFSVLVAVILLTWFLCEKTLSIHGIYTKRREVFYWLTVIATFTLGTAAGDLFADDKGLGLGFFNSIIVFGILFFIPFIGEKLFNWNEIFTFWFSYIMTRPFGASIADWMDGNPQRDGAGVLGIDKKPIVAISLVIIFILLWFMKAKGLDVNKQSKEFNECSAAQE